MFSNLTTTKKINEGGQASIYQVTNSDGESFALKVFKHSFGFEREVHILSKIGCHENIMHMLAHSSAKCTNHTSVNWPIDGVKLDGEDVQYGIIFNLAIEGSLDDFVKSNNFKLDQVQDIISQIVLAVQHVHSMGYAHRDIKPANILVLQASPIRVALADFGLSKRLDSAIERKVDRHGVMEITLTDPWYVCPELYVDQEIDTFAASSDLWSLGVCLWEVCNKTQFIKTRELKQFQDSCIFASSSTNTKKKQKHRNEFVTERLMQLHENQRVPLSAKRAVRNLLDMQPDKRDLDKTLQFVLVN